MPYYDFKCPSCNNIEEVKLKIDERDSQVNCPICNYPMERIAGFGHIKWGNWSSDQYLKYRWPHKPKRNYFTGHKTDWAEKGK